MSVDVEFSVLVGVKGNYNYIRDYKSKNSSDYLFDLNCGDLDKCENIIFKDNIPEGYKVYVDGMGGEYTYFGKELMYCSEYLDEIGEMQIDKNTLNQYIDEVYTNLKALGFEIEKEDVKLHIFTHFS